MSSRNIVSAAVVIIVVVVVAGWMVIKTPLIAQPSPSVSIDQNETPAPTTEQSSASGAMENEGSTVKIISSGFSPKAITIKAGDSVVWMNDDNSAMHNVSSAPHPTHTAYPPLNLGNIPAGGKVSLTFPEAGIYKYHDHLNPTLFGSVTVE